uniref:Uncharacterized protein n=1 Tax=Chromera velia CCMP2878 TaxID=1169474 RepID=A0A0G4HKV9_9ALVE|eukprot:Cvel_28578.t1-p1 / transcript=Cvel_28578.t1 / gene=Cvel_28578 / organism=Chromera_velia_CCMP2878 / gene_product=hypothetical protein / transcript_product=hypothetical protein / location=Cvel_scaffold3766:255-3356(+) / protein_length=888 / sequence_SO=supercontig / SO=protein_coding / is_pseudo=false
MRDMQSTPPPFHEDKIPSCSPVRTSIPLQHDADINTSAGGPQTQAQFYRSLGPPPDSQTLRVPLPSPDAHPFRFPFPAARLHPSAPEFQRLLAPNSVGTPQPFPFPGRSNNNHINIPTGRDRQDPGSAGDRHSREDDSPTSVRTPSLGRRGRGGEEEDAEGTEEGGRGSQEEEGSPSAPSSHSSSSSSHSSTRGLCHQHMPRRNQTARRTSRSKWKVCGLTDAGTQTETTAQSDYSVCCPACAGHRSAMQTQIPSALLPGMKQEDWRKREELQARKREDAGGGVRVEAGVCAVRECVRQSRQSDRRASSPPPRSSSDVSRVRRTSQARGDDSGKERNDGGTFVNEKEGLNSSTFDVLRGAAETAQRAVDRFTEEVEGIRRRASSPPVMSSSSHLQEHRRSSSASVSKPQLQSNKNSSTPCPSVRADAESHTTERPVSVSSAQRRGTQTEQSSRDSRKSKKSRRPSGDPEAAPPSRQNSKSQSVQNEGNETAQVPSACSIHQQHTRENRNGTNPTTESRRSSNARPSRPSFSAAPPPAPPAPSPPSSTVPSASREHRSSSRTLSNAPFQGQSQASHPRQIDSDSPEGCHTCREHWPYDPPPAPSTTAPIDAQTNCRRRTNSATPGRSDHSSSSQRHATQSTYHHPPPPPVSTRGSIEAAALTAVSESFPGAPSSTTQRDEEGRQSQFLHHNTRASARPLKLHRIGSPPGAAPVQPPQIHRGILAPPLPPPATETLQDGSYKPRLHKPPPQPVPACAPVAPKEPNQSGGSSSYSHASGHAESSKSLSTAESLSSLAGGSARCHGLFHVALSGEGRQQKSAEGCNSSCVGGTTYTTAPLQRARDHAGSQIADFASVWHSSRTGASRALDGPQRKCPAPAAESARFHFVKQM